MKQTFALFAVITLIIVHTAAAQVPAKKLSTDKATIEFATKNFLSCLRTDNEGVIESALRLTAEMKIRYPTADMKELVKEMNSVKKNHRNGTIRYKAFLAVAICENPQWYAQLMESFSGNNDAFFRSASETMNEQLMTQTF